MKAITSKYIFNGRELLTNHAVIIENDAAIALAPLLTAQEKQLPITNYGDGVLTHGFIDLQLNGCGGVLFNEQITVETLATMYATCLKYGTTHFLPTLITAPFADVITALEVVKIWVSKYGFSKGVVGLHLEGPFISKLKPGIHPPEFIIKPELALLKQIVVYRQFFPIKMTVAVEEFSYQQLEFLQQNGIILAIGHSDASYTQAKAAIASGAISAATHLFNAMSGISARKPGVALAVLTSDTVNAGLIADLLHVNSANIQFCHQLKKNHFYLVTDAVTPMGTALTEFVLAGKTLQVKDGKCIDNNGVIGGSSLTMPMAVANCVQVCQLPLADVLKAAVSTPAKIMQLGQNFAIIGAGTKLNDIIYLSLTDFNTKNLFDLLYAE